MRPNSDGIRVREVVSSYLSGYVTAVGGEPLAFSILIQNYAGTAKTAMELQENICILLSGFEPQ